VIGSSPSPTLLAFVLLLGYSFTTRPQLVSYHYLTCWPSCWPYHRAVSFYIVSVPPGWHPTASSWGLQPPPTSHGSPFMVTPLGNSRASYSTTSLFVSRSVELHTCNDWLKEYFYRYGHLLSCWPFGFLNIGINIFPWFGYGTWLIFSCCFLPTFYLDFLSSCFGG